jgi:hypothetical protein
MIMDENGTLRSLEDKINTGWEPNSMTNPIKPQDEVEKKLAVVRAAAALDVGPAPDIEQMLAEIEQGYLADPGAPSLEG